MLVYICKQIGTVLRSWCKHDSIVLSGDMQNDLNK